MQILEALGQIPDLPIVIPINVAGEPGLFGFSPDTWVAIFTLALTVVTAVLAGVSIWQGRLILRAEAIARVNAEAAQKSADANFAAQRAWLRVSQDGYGDAILNADGSWGIEIRVVVENLGNVTANEVKEFTLAEPHVTSKLYTQMRAEVEADSNDLGAIRTGYVLFPGERHGSWSNVVLTPEQLATSGQGIVPHIMLCVTYMTNGNRAVTCAALQLSTVMPPPNHRLLTTASTGQNMLVFAPAALGSFAT